MILMVLIYIIAKKHFDSVDLKFLVSEHSYMPCDREFGILEKRKTKMQDQWFQKRNCLRRRTTVVNLVLSRAAIPIRTLAVSVGDKVYLFFKRLSDTEIYTGTIVLHTSTPTYLASRFSYLSSYHNLFTRTENSRILAIPTHKTSSYSSSYTISLSRLCNTLPCDIRDCRNLVEFKSKLIKHFLTA
ncbi:hypothetical protein ANN_05084 [Periplaneta americana]|uniref:Uncharacterized protein n=1 Tax=Periplaneta americana TaxID=6978 RepID=A0ABQ8TBS7_PERAM|nr:hypothetical protein ANN_05084 [Periplaneta americana]